MNNSIYEKNIISTLESPKSATIDKYSITNSILHSAKNLDLVGILSSGSIARGFANSMGQFNWHDSESFNFDWSIYTQSGKAIKQNYSDQIWDDNRFSSLFSESI